MSDQTTEQATEQQPVAQLQIQDILLAAQCIQLASQRGAFRADEFTQVGSLYDRLTAFLKESGAIQQQATEASAQPTSESVSSDEATE